MSKDLEVETILKPYKEAIERAEALVATSALIQETVEWNTIKKSIVNKLSTDNTLKSLHELWHRLYKLNLTGTILKSPKEGKQEFLTIINSYEKILKELRISLEGVS